MLLFSWENTDYIQFAVFEIKTDAKAAIEQTVVF
jgi:hypothetical protein